MLTLLITTFLLFAGVVALRTIAITAVEAEAAVRSIRRELAAFDASRTVVRLRPVRVAASRSRVRSALPGLRAVA
jgi:hypothetical protein